MLCMLLLFLKQLYNFKTEDVRLPEKENSLSLYFHIPFCTAKCGYCDFNSYALETLIDKNQIQKTSWASEYTDALIREIKTRAKELQLKEIKVESVFFGGGTPSLFPPEEIERILTTVKIYFNLSPNIEISLEANPNSSDYRLFKKLNAAKINRISFGVQSFNNKLLKNLDRLHSGSEAKDAFFSAREAGFKNISIDLMFGIPFQTKRIAYSDIQTAINLDPEHISAYELTIEPGTSFHALHMKGELEGLANEKLSLEMWEMRDKLLHDAGYEQYEISNFSKPEFFCKHNLNYWNRGDYLGIGAGAHSLIDNKRFWNHLRPDTYIKNSQSPTAGEEKMEDKAKILGESLMLGLRLKDGISLRKLKRKTGLDSEDLFQDYFQDFYKKKLLIKDRGKLKLTKKGMLLSNQIFSCLL